MAYRKRRFSRKRRFVRRTRRVGRRRIFRRRVGRLRFNNLFHFRTVYLKDTVSLTSNIQVNKGYSFRLSDSPEAGQVGSLWDAYRLNKVVLRVIPRQNTYAAGGANPVAAPQVVSCIDYDDVDTLATTTDYLSFGTARIHSAIHPFSIKFTPAVNNGVSTNAGTTEVLPGNQRFKQWIDMNLAGVPHYGVKMQFAALVPLPTTTNPIVFELWAKCYYSFKQRR